MGQNVNYAAVMDARMESSMEECAGRMVLKPYYAAAKGVQINLRKEECAEGTVHMVEGDIMYNMIRTSQGRVKV